MKFDTSFWMMFAFIVFMIIGIWKIWAFLPTKQLQDDDKTESAEHELKRLILEVIKQNDGKIDSKELFFAITEHEEFDSKLFWRFNHNRLNQLLNSLYLTNPKCSNIMDIYKELCS